MKYVAWQREAIAKRQTSLLIRELMEANIHLLAFSNIQMHTAIGFVKPTRSLGIPTNRLT
jgi:hypothetical protein